MCVAPKILVRHRITSIAHVLTSGKFLWNDTRIGAWDEVLSSMNGGEITSKVSTKAWSVETVPLKDADHLRMSMVSPPLFPIGIIRARHLVIDRYGNVSWCGGRYELAVSLSTAMQGRSDACECGPSFKMTLPLPHYSSARVLGTQANERNERKC